MRTITIYTYDELNWKGKDTAVNQFLDDDFENEGFDDVEDYIRAHGFEFSEYGYRVWQEVKL